MIMFPRMRLRRNRNAKGRKIGRKNVLRNLIGNIGGGGDGD
jgi:hypothetical protein